MKTTIESTDRYQVIISQAKEKGIILQSKINNNVRNENSGGNN